jgi:hypothetical protein
MQVYLHVHKMQQIIHSHICTFLFSLSLISLGEKVSLPICCHRASFLVYFGSAMLYYNQSQGEGHFVSSCKLTLIHIQGVAS